MSIRSILNILTSTRYIDRAEEANENRVVLKRDEADIRLISCFDSTFFGFVNPSDEANLSLQHVVGQLVVSLVVQQSLNITIVVLRVNESNLHGLKVFTLDGSDELSIQRTGHVSVEVLTLLELRIGNSLNSVNRCNVEVRSEELEACGLVRGLVVALEGTNLLRRLEDEVGLDVLLVVSLVVVDLLTINHSGDVNPLVGLHSIVLEVTNEDVSQLSVERIGSLLEEVLRNEGLSVDFAVATITNNLVRVE